jgi:hypothetical protein
LIQSPSAETPQASVAIHTDPISNYLLDKESVDSGLDFLKACQFIYSFDAKKSFADSLKFIKAFTEIKQAAIQNNINIVNIENEYNLKSSEFKKIGVVINNSESLTIKTRRKETQNDKIN